MRFTTMVEGRTRLEVTWESLNNPVPPTSPVFFNPVASVNRDVSVALTGAAGGERFLDSMSGVGARGVRVAREVSRDMQVALVDINPVALRIGRRNAKANGVSRRCVFQKSDANLFCYGTTRDGERYDFIDLDPFGTPAPYLQSMLTAVEDGGIASVTATDTAVLCGVHPDVALRRYWARPLNNEYCHETAVRILVNACRRVAGQIDLGIEPILAHSTRHYVRVFLRVRVGASAADRCSVNEGNILDCPRCGERDIATDEGTSCPACGGVAKRAGPMWVGDLVDPTVLRKAMKVAEGQQLEAAAAIFRGVADVNSFPPWSFSIDRICSGMKTPTVPVSSVVGILEDAGFQCATQPFEVKGIKTDAGHSEVVDAVELASSSR